MIIYDKPVYLCGHCKKMYKVGAACEKHEKVCPKNPDHESICMRCKFAGKKDLSIVKKKKNGQTTIATFESFYCTLKEVYLKPLYKTRNFTYAKPEYIPESMKKECVFYEKSSDRNIPVYDPERNEFIYKKNKKES